MQERCTPEAHDCNISLREHAPRPPPPPSCACMLMSEKVHFLATVSPQNTGYGSDISIQCTIACIVIHGRVVHVSGGV